MMIAFESGFCRGDRVQWSLGVALAVTKASSKGSSDRDVERKAVYEPRSRLSGESSPGGLGTPDL